MKVAIGYHIQEGPWGGGNQFARSLAEALTGRGDRVAFDLADPDIDLIMLTDPRSRSPSVSFGPGAILRYLAFRNPNALVVHRVNECDERKGTRHMNSMLRRANYAADHTVFIASWLKALDLWRRETPASVILNGADVRLFRPATKKTWDGSAPLKLVTHHWGGNRLKGFDVYEMLDRMLADPVWKDRIAFTYVGRLPEGVSLVNARCVSALSGAALAEELASHDAYITGSLNEPAGMHHIEGALCGLPLIYRNSGALLEYCDGFGVPIDGPDDLAGAIGRIIAEYSSFREAIKNYPHSAANMCAGYLALFDRLIADRKRIVAERRIWRNPMLVLRNQIPI